MPGVSVVVPWRPGCPHREAAWEWVRRSYAERHPEWEVVEGRHDEGPWCKAAAVGDALQRTTGQILVIADADVWTDALRPAVAVVEAGAGWVVPRCEVRRLNAESTRRVLDGEPPSCELVVEQRPYRGVYAGGAVVLARESYDVAPLDRRFLGWGSEDESWSVALTGLIGSPVLLEWHRWPLWHLWHPAQPRLSRAVGSQESAALFRRYRAVRNSPERLRVLVDQGRTP